MNGIELKELTTKNWHLWHTHTKATFQMLGLMDMLKGKNKNLPEGGPTMLKRYNCDKKIAWYLLSKAMSETHTARVIQAEEDPIKLYKSLKEFYNSTLESSKFEARNTWQETVQEKNEKFETFYQRWVTALSDVIETGQRVNDRDKTYTLMKAVLPKYSGELRTIRQLMTSGNKISYEEVGNILRDADMWYNNIRKPRPERARQLEVSKPERLNKLKNLTKVETRKCYNCNIHGHLSKNCPQPQRKRHRSDDQIKNSKTTKRIRRVQLKRTVESKYCDDQAAYANAALVTNDGNTYRAIADSGCTRHMSPNKELFSNYRTFTEPKPIKIADESTIYAMGTGDIITRHEKENEIMELVWEDSYYVPKLGVCLFSCTQITKQGMNVLFTDTTMKLIPRDGSESF